MSTDCRFVYIIKSLTAPDEHYVGVTSNVLCGCGRTMRADAGFPLHADLPDLAANVREVRPDVGQAD